MAACPPLCRHCSDDCAGWRDLRPCLLCRTGRLADRLGRGFLGSHVFLRAFRLAAVDDWVHRVEVPVCACSTYHDLGALLADRYMSATRGRAVCVAGRPIDMASTNLIRTNRSCLSSFFTSILVSPGSTVHPFCVIVSGRPLPYESERPNRLWPPATSQARACSSVHVFHHGQIACQTKTRLRDWLRVCQNDLPGLSSELAWSACECWVASKGTTETAPRDPLAGVGCADSEPGTRQTRSRPKG
jgi:hypothetical protein